MSTRPATKRRRLRTALVASSALVAAAAVAVPQVIAPAGAQQSEQLSGQKLPQTSVRDEGYADLVEAVLPAVVNVQVEGQGRMNTAQMMPNQPDMREFFERFFGEELPREFQRPQPSPRQRGEGSGFIIDPEGLVVTNAHVVSGAETITVVMQDESEHEAELIGVDEKTDLALVRITTDEPLPFVEWGDSDAIRVGEKVLAVGNPFGLGGTVTAGIVSARGREIGAGPYDDFLQIDASINRGNSGGPTFDLDGNVVGVNTLIFSPTGGNVGIGFAIAANLAKEIIADLEDDGMVERGWLGVSIQDVDEDLARALGLDEPRGALVSEVLPDSPAAGSDITQGDVIVGVDDSSIERVRDLTRAVAEIKPGTTSRFEVLRDGERKTVRVEVGQSPSGEEQTAALQSDESDRPRLGLQLSESEDGEVVIAAVEPGSPAAEKGLRAGDVILSVGEQPVDSAQAVMDAVAAAHEAEEDVVLMRIQREGQTVFRAIPFEAS